MSGRRQRMWSFSTPTQVITKKNSCTNWLIWNCFSCAQEENASASKDVPVEAITKKLGSLEVEDGSEGKGGRS